MSSAALNTWVVLLRGVNVGGNNTLPMASLRASCERDGFVNATTYIQSGNLVLDAESGVTEPEVVERVRSLLLERHGLAVPVVARAANELSAVAVGHPGAAGDVDPKYLHVAFLDRSVDTSGRAGPDPASYLPDAFELAGRHIYLTYPHGAGRSKLTIDLFERAHGVVATARNLNTVRVLANWRRG